MAVSTAILRVAANTSNGNQDFVESSFGGGTPKLAIVIFQKNAVTDGVAADQLYFSYGYATAVAEQGCISGNGIHNDTSGDYRSQLELDRVIQGNAPGGAGQLFRGDFVSFLTNGVRINWVTAPATAGFVTVILIGGDDFQAKVGNHAIEVNPAVTDVNTIGFQPDAVLSHIINGDGSGSLRFGMGVAWDEPSVGIKQHSMTTYHNNNANPTDISDAIYNDTATSLKFRTSALVDVGVAISDFDSDGFSARDTVSQGVVETHFYVAMAFGPNKFHFGTYASPLATGDDVEEIGFKPQLVNHWFMEDIDAFNSQTRGGTHGWAVFNESVEFCNSESDEDGRDAGVDGTNTQSLSSAKAIDMPNGDGSIDGVATFSSFDTLGYTLNYTQVQSPQLGYLQWSIEENVVGETLSIAGAIAPGSVLTREALLREAGAIAPAGAITRAAEISPAGAVAPGGVVAKEARKLLQGLITPAGVLTAIKSILLSFAGAITPSSVLTREGRLPKAGAIAPAGAITRAAEIAPAGVVAPAGTVAKRSTKDLAGTLTPAGALTALKTILLALAGTIATAGALLRSPRKSVAGTLAPSASVAKDTAKGVGGSIAPAGAIRRLTAFVVAGVLGLAGVVATATGIVTIIAKPFLKGSFNRAITLKGKLLRAINLKGKVGE